MQKLLAERVSPKVAYRLVRDHPPLTILAKLELLRDPELRGQLRNIPGFLRLAIEQDYQPRVAGEQEPPTPIVAIRDGELAATGESVRLPVVLPPQPGPEASLWQRASWLLLRDLGAAAWDQWIAPVEARPDGKRLLLLAPDVRVQRYLEQRLRQSIQQAVELVAGERQPAVSITSNGEALSA